MFVPKNCGKGGSLRAQTKCIQEALDASLVRWLSLLKTRAEGPEAQVFSRAVQYSSGSKIQLDERENGSGISGD